MAESGINVSALSYSKMILHAVKFPHCAVSGVLVGRRLNSDTDVTDAVPAMHSVVLAPPMEILFIQLDAYCREKQSDIVGLYFANQVLANKSLDDTLLRIAAEKIPNPVILQIDNSKLALNAVAPCLRAFRQDGTIKWREVEFSVDNLDDTLALTSFAIQNKFHRGLVDFENHLDEPLAADFYNLDLNEKLFQINEL